MSGKIRAGLVSALVTSFAAIGLTPAASPAVAAPENTPLGKVLIVVNNLTEDDKGDVRRTGDMRNFVDETLRLAPRIPDVLALQEVRAKSVRVVKELMTRRTGQKYVTVVGAPRNPMKKVGAHRLLQRNNAILINSETMKVAGDKGELKHSYKRSQSADGNVVVKTTPFALVAERGDEADGVLKVPIASVHLRHDSDFRTMTLGRKLKARWAKQIADKLSSKWPGSEFKRTIAGDFNNRRCISGKNNLNCTQAPDYNMLTKRKGYKDAIRAIQGHWDNPVDFVFTRSNVVSANSDPYAATKGPEYYSDHRLRWAMIEGPDTTAPTDPGKIKIYAGYKGMIHFGRWELSRDGGVGWKSFEIWRAHGRDSNDWRMIGTTKVNTMYKDYDVQALDWYRYKIRTVDHLGHFQETPVIEVKAG